MSDLYTQLLLEDADSALTEPRIAPDETSIAPDWADVPGLMQENFAESGKQMASDIYQMVRHPVDTVTAIAD